MTLKALQTEWERRAKPKHGGYGDYIDVMAEKDTYQFCAEALTPFILQQERDTALIRSLIEAFGERARTPSDWELHEQARSRLKEME